MTDERYLQTLAGFGSGCLYHSADADTFRAQGTTMNKSQAISPNSVAGKWLPILAIVLTVSACTNAEQDADAAAPCRPEAAAALIGQTVVDEDAIRNASGGVSLVRRLAPGDMATKDFRIERLTVYVNDQGRVVSAGCN